ncbi:hypothetical protein F2Q70_00043718 [Brassica cretica]|uniref:Uncharacterized protein n=1 Tax=Brassica cretica TaxID=69181 RepID=A0A8S9KK99_BRACR|nr:hypothetical protein F2Q70_00043718 [Brassica cretica]KAF3520815.1 hypothetical protein DY000_02061048 [Brassica cretica]
MSPPGGLDSSRYIRFKCRPAYFVYFTFAEMTFLLSIFNYTMLNREPDERLNNGHKFLARLSSPRTPAPTSNSHTPTNRSWPPYITLALSIAKLDCSQNQGLTGNISQFWLLVLISK